MKHRFHHESQAPIAYRVIYSHFLHTDTRIRLFKLYKQSRPAVAAIIHHAPVSYRYPLTTYFALFIKISLL